MNTNPLSNGVNTNLTPEDPVNDRTKENRPSYNTFSLKSVKALTARFGDVTPFLVSNVVSGDHHRFSNKHDLRTYTLAAPLMSPIKMTKSYFFVPNKAILPNSWDNIFVNPKFGEDIPEDELCKFHPSMFVYWLMDANSNATTLIDKFYIAALCRNFFSEGSLLSYLGYSLPTACYVGDTLFDSCVDSIVSAVETTKPTISYLQTVGTNDILVDQYTLDGSKESVRKLFDLFEGDYDINIQYAPSGILTALNTYISGCLSASSSAFPVSFKPWNLSRVYAYQLVAAQYFCNDDVDNINTSDLYTRNLRAIGIKAIGSDVVYHKNGIRFQSDLISEDFLNAIFGNSTDEEFTIFGVRFFLNLFTYKMSLRFGDYFAGSRTRPLAVGDVTIGVSANKVSVVDVTQNIAKQRFLNLVNRTVSTIAQYTKALFGVVPDENPSIPKFLASSHSGVGNPESSSENGYVGSPTSDLRSNDGQYEFTMEFNDYGILLGLVSFDVVGCYKHITDRHNLAYDRFDMYNPMTQTFGDQPVFCQEINPDSVLPSQAWAYQQKYAEFKSEVNTMLGGFASGALPGWIFEQKKPTYVISPDFIRHSRTELDKYYSSLTGSSLANYFHFQIVFANDLVSNRPMEFDSPVL